MDDEPEISQPSVDLEGLVDHLDGLSHEGKRIIEVTYTINNWTLGGVIPLRHHGFTLGISSGEYVTLDFGRRGILWDVFDDYPGEPDGTFFIKRYQVDVNPGTVKAYCESTEPFSWLSNDCASWARGFMQAARIFEDPLDDASAFLKPEQVTHPARGECQTCE